MRALVTIQPAYGHLHPLVPMCQALIGAGHDVAIATAASFRPQVEATGTTAITAGIDWLESELHALPGYEEHRARGESKAFLQSEIFGWRTALAMARDVERIAKQRQVDVVIREPWEFGGAIAATRLGIPCVLHGIGAFANVEEVLSMAEGRLTQHAAKLGVVDDLRSWLCGALYLDPCPPVLQSAGDSLPASSSRQPVRPQLFDATDGSVDALGWLAAPRGRPLVYVGLGTVMNSWQGLLQRLVAELTRLDLEVAVTTGPGADPADWSHLPPNVHVARYIPLTTLLPHCDAVVCHAGWGTTISALAHGLPIVAIPLGADGPRTAARIDEAGAGRVVELDDVGRGNVAEEVANVLANPRFRKAARAARRQIEQMSEPRLAVGAIESLSRSLGQEVGSDLTVAPSMTTSRHSRKRSSTVRPPRK